RERPLQPEDLQLWRLGLPARLDGGETVDLPAGLLAGLAQGFQKTAAVPDVQSLSTVTSHRHHSLWLCVGAGVCLGMNGLVAVGAQSIASSPSPSERPNTQRVTVRIETDTERIGMGRSVSVRATAMLPSGRPAAGDL